MTTTLRKAKKARKNVEQGVVTINATFNNTHVAISDQEGNVLTWFSGGRAGFKGSREATPYAAQVTVEKAMEEVKRQYGLAKCTIVVKGVGPGRDSAIRGVVGSAVEILSIFDETPVPHNGCRKKKVRFL